jgi:hypothetical protein
MMMTEAGLVKKIQVLKKIRPRKDWVVLTKSQILGEEPKILFFPFFKPALATVTAFGILFGVFSLAQNSLPGDILYPLKKIAERGQAVFVSEEEKPTFQFELANKRLEELTEITQTNQVKKIAPAIEEFQANVSEAAKSLVKVKKVDEKIVAQTKKLEENKESIEKVLATRIEIKEYDTAIAQLVEGQIEELKNQSLTEAQQELLEGAEEDFEAGNYNQALEKILILSYQ